MADPACWELAPLADGVLAAIAIPGRGATANAGVVDLGGVWRVTRGLEARLRLGNLFDQEYLGSPDEVAVPAPGRSVLLTVSARF